jgi:hypothetical protein
MSITITITIAIAITIMIIITITITITIAITITIIIIITVTITIFITCAFSPRLFQSFLLPLNPKPILSLSRKMVQLYLFLALKGVVVGELVHFVDVDAVIDEQDSTLGLMSTAAFDSVAACTSLDVELQEPERDRLVQKLRSCFEDISIIVNFRVCVRPEVRLVSTQPDVEQEKLLNWVRLHCCVKIEAQRTGTSSKQQYHEALSKLRVSNRQCNEWIALAAILSPAVFLTLFEHFKQGQMFGHSSDVVRKCFDMAVHAFQFLKSQSASAGFHLEDADVDAFLKRCIKRSFNQSYKHVQDLSAIFKNWFRDYAQHFKYLVMSAHSQPHSLQLQTKKVIVKRAECGEKWNSAQSGHKLYWSGNRWQLEIDGQTVGSKVVSRHQCIPMLSCLQGAARWSFDSGVEWTFSVGTEEMYDASQHEWEIVGVADAAAAASRSAHSEPSEQSRLPLTSTQLPLKRMRVNINSEVLCQNGFFFGWSPHLNQQTPNSQPNLGDFNSFLQSVQYSYLFGHADVRARPHPSRRARPHPSRQL